MDGKRKLLDLLLFRKPYTFIWSLDIILVFLTVCEHEVILAKHTQLHIDIDRYHGINFQFCQRLEDVCFLD